MGLGALLENQLAIGKSSRSCTYTLLLPQGGKIELIFALRAAVSKIRAIFFNLPYLGMKLGKWPKFQKLEMHAHFTPMGVEIEVTFTLRAAVSEIRTHFQDCHIWAETW